MASSSLPAPASQRARSFARPTVTSRLACRYLTLLVCALGALYVLTPVPGPRPGWARPPFRAPWEEQLDEASTFEDVPDDVLPPMTTSPPPPPPEPVSPWPARADRVRDAFRHAFDGYLQYAFPHDELQPLSNSSVDNFNGWAVSAVDSLDTMMLMGLDDLVSILIPHVANLRLFEKPAIVVVGMHAPDMPHYVPFFETTIRYLGGLLSAYAMSGDSVLLARADDLGRALLPAFNTTSGLPAFAVDVTTGDTRSGWMGSLVILSEIATCQLEFRALAHYTGRAEYVKAVDFVTEHLRTVNHTDGLFPLVYGQYGGEPRDTRASVGAMADSAYEYLLKGWLQTNKTENNLLDMYMESIEGIINNLLYLSPGRELLYVTDTSSGVPTGRLEHLSCFLAGLLALGHATIPHAPDRHAWAADGLAHTCWLTYADQPSGLGPDEVRFLPVEGKDPAEQAANGDKFWNGTYLWVNALERWEGAGAQGAPPGTGQALPVTNASETEYILLRRDYLLRPESVESWYLLWRTTGEEKWRERGWAAFEALEKHSRRWNGFASVEDVTTAETGLHKNEMPSWFLAETLKYFFLLFTDDELVPLDRWVFNTEAHPLPIFEWAGWERELFNISRTRRSA